MGLILAGSCYTEEYFLPASCHGNEYNIKPAAEITPEVISLGKMLPIEPKKTKESLYKYGKLGEQKIVPSSTSLIYTNKV